MISLIGVAIYGDWRAVAATRQRAACKSRAEMAAPGLDKRLFLPCTRSSNNSMPLLVPAIVEVCLCTGPEPPVIFHTSLYFLDFAMVRASPALAPKSDHLNIK